MKTERFTIKACCGRTNVIFKLDRPIDVKLLTFLVDMGFVEDPKMTKAGILYVDNPDFTLTGALGANKLQAQCKLKDCAQQLNNLEEIFLQLE